MFDISAEAGASSNCFIASCPARIRFSRYPCGLADGGMLFMKSTPDLFLPWHVQIGDRSLESFRGHPDCFGQRRMRMDRKTDVCGIGTHFDCECRLCDQIACRRPNDAAADNAFVFLVKQ